MYGTVVSLPNPPAPPPLARGSSSHYLRHVKQRSRVVWMLFPERLCFFFGSRGVGVVCAAMVTSREFTSRKVMGRRGRRGMSGTVMTLQRRRGVGVEPLGFVPSFLKAIEFGEIVSSCGDVWIAITESSLGLDERATQVHASLFVSAARREVAADVGVHTPLSRRFIRRGGVRGGDGCVQLCDVTFVYSSHVIIII